MDKWEEITKEILEDLYFEQLLSDSQIAQMYHVTRRQVCSKRKKFNIYYEKQQYKSVKRNNKEMFDMLNRDSKERLLKPENIDGISKALTHYLFRNGPVEDMHSDGKLSEEDMKTLNKYMVNRIAGLLTTIKDDDWVLLELLYSDYQMFGGDWDEAEPDTDEFDLVMHYKLKRNA